MARIEVTDEQISAAQAGDNDAMWTIVAAFEPQLLSIVRSAAPSASAEDVEDLLQEARIVLIQHIRDYNTSSSSAALNTFVYRAARRAVTEAHISMTTSLTVDASTVVEVRRALAEADGDVTRAWKIVEASTQGKRLISRERFTATVEALASAVSFDAPVSDGDDAPGMTIGDTLADRTPDSVDVDRRDYARWLMTQIPPRQAYALRAYFGVQMTPSPDGQVADEMGLRPAAVRRLRSAGSESARRVATIHGHYTPFTPLFISAA